MAIPKFSEWKQNTPEVIEIDNESFKFLFDARKRDKRKPNEQRHNFIKAFAKAVKKIADRNEDRFPYLDEIKQSFPDISAKAENDVIFQLKHHIIEKTRFFNVEEWDKRVYLVPKARKYKDIGGMYSDLIFDFDKGNVTMPELKQASDKSPCSDKEPESNSNTGKTENTDESEKTSIALSENFSKLEPSQISPELPEKTENNKLHLKKALIYGIIIIVLAALVFHIMSDSNTNLDENYIIYSINNSNDDEGEFIMFYLINPDNIMINSSIILPTDVFQSFSAEKGTFSSSFPPYSNYSIIRWKTNEDSKMKIYVNTFDKIPFELTLHNNSGRNVRLLGIDNFKQTKTGENIQWNFEIRRSH